MSLKTRLVIVAAAGALPVALGRAVLAYLREQ
jgi:hypothetical protein